MKSRPLTEKEIEELTYDKSIVINPCKNNCGNSRRHGSAYCQECSDKYKKIIK